MRHLLLSDLRDTAPTALDCSRCFQAFVGINTAKAELKADGALELVDPVAACSKPFECKLTSSNLSEAKLSWRFNLYSKLYNMFCSAFLGGFAMPRSSLHRGATESGTSLGVIVEWSCKLVSGQAISKCFSKKRNSTRLYNRRICEKGDAPAWMVGSS